MSDAFAFLSVLSSIILGLAVAEILQGYSSLLLSRAKVRLYGPPLIWSVIMLMMATQFWWASFGLLFLAVGFVKDWLLDRTLDRPTNFLFLGFFVLMTLLSLLVRLPRLHEIMAPIMGATILIYFGLKFQRI